MVLNVSVHGYVVRISNSLGRFKWERYHKTAADANGIHTGSKGHSNEIEAYTACT